MSDRIRLVTSRPCPTIPILAWRGLGKISMTPRMNSRTSCVLTVFRLLMEEWRESIFLDSSDSIGSDLIESLVCSLGLWRRGASSDTDSVSALGFSLDHFRGPMK